MNVIPPFTPRYPFNLRVHGTRSQPPAAAHGACAAVLLLHPGTAPVGALVRLASHLAAVRHGHHLRGIYAPNQFSLDVTGTTDTFGLSGVFSRLL